MPEAEWLATAQSFKHPKPLQMGEQEEQSVSSSHSKTATGFPPSPARFSGPTWPFSAFLTGLMMEEGRGSTPWPGLLDLLLRRLLDTFICMKRRSSCSKLPLGLLPSKWLVSTCRKQVPLPLITTFCSCCIEALNICLSTMSSRAQALKALASDSSQFRFPRQAPQNSQRWVL